MKKDKNIILWSLSTITTFVTYRQTYILILMVFIKKNAVINTLSGNSTRELENMSSFTTTEY